VLENGLGGGGAEDEGDEAPGASAARAGEDVGLEGPPEELGPGEGTPGLVGADGPPAPTGKTVPRPAMAGQEAWARRGAAPGRWGRGSNRAWIRSSRRTPSGESASSALNMRCTMARP
jgi:hypothetical protein